MRISSPSCSAVLGDASCNEASFFRAGCIHFSRLAQNVSKILKSMFSTILLLILFAALIPTYIQAAPQGAALDTRFYSGTTSAEFSCNTLYTARDGTSSSASYGISRVIFNPSKTSYTLEDIIGIDNGASGTSTIALGPNPWNGKLTMYGWRYNSSTATRPVAYIEDGATQAYRLTHLIPNPGSGNSSYSGGEVNQKTGEVYLSGFNGLSITDAGYRLAVFNPLTGTLEESGRLQAGPGESIASNGRVGSDMAIDAEGNFYLVVGNSNASNTRYLVKVERGSAGGGGNILKLLH